MPRRRKLRFFSGQALLRGVERSELLGGVVKLRCHIHPLHHYLSALHLRGTPPVVGDTLEEKASYQHF